MSYSREEVEARAAQYAATYGLNLEEQLGFGVHGVVWAASRTQKPSRARISAIKVHAPDSPHYSRERDIYLRLREFGVKKVRGFSVPRLFSFDDTLSVIEMAIVRPPFVLDFAGAYLDRRPDFSQEIMAEWLADKREQFEERWPEVQAVLRAFEQYGVYLSDVSPNNIRFRREV